MSSDKAWWEGWGSVVLGFVLSPEGNLEFNTQKGLLVMELRKKQNHHFSENKEMKMVA